MKCVLCGGRMEERLVTFQDECDGHYVLVENVPATVCAACGERVYSPEVTDKLLRIARTSPPSARTVEVPLLDFAQAG